MKSLFELTTKIGSGATPKGGANAYKSEGISLIRSQNVLDLRFSENGLAFIDDEQASKLSNVEVFENDILLNITGDSVARVCKVDSNWLPARVNQHVAIIRPNPELLDSDYLLYVLVSPRYKKLLLNLASAGATRNALTKGMIEQFEIPYFDLNEQKSIAKKLKSLDDKIELNRQMNETLEEMAQALFKSWFVDFDPVIDKALAAGNDIPEPLKQKAEKRKFVPDTQKLIHTNPELAAHFPDSFTFTEELGWIPDGWEVRSLGEISSLKYGKMPDKAKIGSGDFVTYSGYKYLDQYPEMNCSKGTLIVVARGVGGTGDIKVTIRDCFLTNLSISIKTNTWSYYLLHYLQPKGLRNLDSGSAQSQITINDLSKVNVHLPDVQLLNQWLKIYKYLNDKILSNLNNLTGLEEIRDTLLPKLISGELRVPEAEKIIADHV